MNNTELEILQKSLTSMSLLEFEVWVGSLSQPYESGYDDGYQYGRDYTGNYDSGYEDGYVDAKDEWSRE